jgi:hypothetical protein
MICKSNNIPLCDIAGVLSEFIIIIISLLMSPLLSTGLPYGSHIKRTGHNPSHGPSADWWVLTTANAAETNGLTCLLKHGGTLDNKFLVTRLCPTNVA